MKTRPPTESQHIEEPVPIAEDVENEEDQANAAPEADDNEDDEGEGEELHVVEQGQLEQDDFDKIVLTRKHFDTMARTFDHGGRGLIKWSALQRALGRIVLAVVHIPKAAFGSSLDLLSSI